MRRIVERSGLAWDAPAPFEPTLSGEDGKTLAQALLAPTRIYVKTVLPHLKAGRIEGLAHITGGGLIENVPRVLPDRAVAEIDAKSWPLPPVFAWLKKSASIEAQELARTFNCGIGMVVAVEASRADAVKAVLEAHGETVYRIGHVRSRLGSEAQSQVLGAEEAWRG